MYIYYVYVCIYIYVNEYLCTDCNFSIKVQNNMNNGTFVFFQKSTTSIVEKRIVSPHAAGVGDPTGFCHLYSCFALLPRKKNTA